MNGNRVINDPLAVIYNESNWRICRVSPMHNLEYDELKLKQYAAKLRQNLVSSVIASTSVKFNVLIEDLPYLKYSENDPNSLMITISSTQENNNNKDKILYMAILLSWGVCVSINNVIHLPYMLERGELKIGSSIRNTLQMLFDCNIKQYNFSQHQLLQFGFNFVENDTSRSSDPFTLNYKTPQANFKDKITLTFEIGDIHSIWNELKDDSSSEINVVQQAYQLLQNQVYHTMTLDITVFDLCEVLLSKAEVKNNGIVKMKTPEIVNSVFTVLNEISYTFLTAEFHNENS